MKPSLSRKAEKVQDVLREKGFEIRVRELPDSTRTARDAARAVGCETAQIAKSLVFMDKERNEPVLIIASGTNTVSLERIRQATGRTLVKADGKAVKDRVGFAIGGVPPVGHNEKLVTLLDPDLKQYDRIWAAAGTPHAVFELRSRDLGPLTDGTWVDLKEL